MRKKLLFFILTILVIIIIMFFFKSNYKNFKIGNNENNKSVKETEQYILNVKSYNATLETTIKSNKNQNKYVLRQEYSKDGEIKQTVIKPENIEGTELVYKDGNLKISNSNLNLSKIYSNYPYISDNTLWLSSFCETYSRSQKSSSYEEHEYVVMQVNIENNAHFNLWKLYVEKSSGKPKKMVVQDNNRNDVIYILYTEINLN